MKRARKKFEGKKFHLLSDRELPPTLSSASFHGCTFSACDYGATAKTPAERRRIADVELIDCKATANCSLGPVVLDSVDVENFGTGGLCFAWSTAFRHVRIRGKCGSLLLSFRSLEREPAFQQANREFYAGVDWALDISDAEFAALELRGLPADLVRRDPETQVIVRREKVLRLEKKWRGVAMHSPWPSSLHSMLEWGFEDQVLVAPKRSKNFADRVRDLRRLQKWGVADRD